MSLTKSMQQRGSSLSLPALRCSLIRYRTLWRCGGRGRHPCVPACRLPPMSSTPACIPHPVEVWGNRALDFTVCASSKHDSPIPLRMERSTGSIVLRAEYLPHASLPPHMSVLGSEPPQPSLLLAFPMCRTHQRPQASSDPDVAQERLPPTVP